MNEWNIIMWDLKCPFHDIPLLTKKDSAFAKCPKCNCVYFKFELRNPYTQRELIRKGKYVED